MDPDARSRPPIDRDRLVGLLDGTGIDVEVLEQAGSTNAVAAERVRAGVADHRTVVLAEHQTAGRGRLDRGWETPARSALTFSTVLRPDVSPQRWPWLPLLVGYAVHRALAEHGVPSALKWPNDVLVDPSAPSPGTPGKVAGILVERVEGRTGPVAVAGIGLNVTTTADELPVATATSLLAATERAPDRTDLLATLLRTLVATHDDWRTSEEEWLRTAYQAACDTVGRDVRVELPGGEPLRGRALAIDHEGRLVVQGPEGPVRLSVGDVVHVRPSATQPPW